MNKKNSIFTWIKRALIVILAIIFLVLAFYPAFAEESTTSKVISGELKTDGGTLIYTVTDNQASISSFSGELTDVVVPSSVDNYPIVAIEDYAFANSAMTSISLPDSVTTIGKGAFYLCESLKTVSLGKNVQFLGEYLFYYCSSLESFSIPDSLTFVPGYFFYACFSLKDVTMPKTIQYIGDYGFYACKSLETISLPEGLTSIGNYAFYACPFTKISFPKSLTQVGDYAFYFCSNLQSITITKAIQYFGTGSLLSCKSLNKIFVEEGNQYYSVSNNILFSYDKKVLVCYPESRNDFSYSIPNGVEKIANEAFSKCAVLKKITFPNTVKEIGDYAFAECTGLTALDLPSGLLSIGYDSFYSCTGLTKVVIPSTVTTLGVEAFAECTALKSVTLSSALQEIHNYAFFECKALESIKIPAKVEAIGIGLFIGCEKLSSITVDKGNSVLCAKDGVLYSKDMKELLVYPCAKDSKKVEIDKKVRSIAAYAFALNPHITEIVLPSKLESIGERAFEGLKITSISIPKTLEEMGGGIFACCYLLKDVVIDKKNTNFVFENGAIFSADKLTMYDYLCTNTEENVVLDVSLAEVKDSAFSGNKYIKTVTFLNASSSIGSAAFADCSEDLVLMSFPQSTASAYAQNNGLKFAVTGEKVPTTKATTKTTISSKTARENHTNQWKIVFWTTIGLLGLVVVSAVLIFLRRKNM